MEFIFFYVLTVLQPILSELIIRYPPDLQNQFKSTNYTIKIGLSNFGMIPYGHSIVGMPYHKFNSEGVNYGCLQSETPIIFDHPKVDSSPIIVLDRGGDCLFVQKVSNVEKNNGHVALIINNSTEEEISDVVMADDGEGMRITIPGIIISKKDGDIIKKFLKDNPDKHPIFEVEFTMENKTNVVQYDLWYTPNQVEVYKLLGEFFPYQSVLRNHSTLNIHLVTFAHYDYDPSIQKEYLNCLSSGEYCIRESSSSKVKGQDVLKEGIRQKCIYNYAYGNNKFEVFWRYMYNFYTDCLLKSDFRTECSIYTMKVTKISISEITSCFVDSYGLKDEKEKLENYELLYPNSLLENEVKQKKEWYISKVPSLFVNKREFRSSWHADYLLEAICAGLRKKPEYCFIDGYFSKEKGLSTGSIVGIVMLIIAINAVIFYFCIRFIRRMVGDQLKSTDLKIQVNETVQNYLKMREPEIK